MARTYDPDLEPQFTIPKNYKLVSRITLDHEIRKLLLERLRTADVYNSINEFEDDVAAIRRVITEREEIAYGTEPF